uniref:Uncharacterized protein n=1 Tax=Oryza punctata TaxID=4537 RepID=A0A0E0KS05_ORYPU
MRLPASGIVRLVALVFLLIFSSSLQQQAGVGAIRLHDRKQHGKQWEEERTQMRSFMTMDYSRISMRNHETFSSAYISMSQQQQHQQQQHLRKRDARRS